uniref:Uncharacterized protein n=1 Tax=Anguilla anguilla TaxID=7936 RepID=A0A0E9W655_ANGAN
MHCNQDHFSSPTAAHPLSGAGTNDIPRPEENSISQSAQQH